MGYLLKLKCAHSPLNLRILSSTSVPFTITTVLVPNLALTHIKRITVWAYYQLLPVWAHFSKPNNISMSRCGPAISCYPRGLHFSKPNDFSMSRCGPAVSCCPRGLHPFSFHCHGRRDSTRYRIVYMKSFLKRYNMNGRFQMQGGKNWIYKDQC